MILSDSSIQRPIFAPVLMGPGICTCTDDFGARLKREWRSERA